MAKRKERVLACVFGGTDDGALIRTAGEIAEDSGARFCILSIKDKETQILEKCEYFESMHTIAKNTGAEITVTYSDMPAITAISFIKKYKITRVVLSAGTETGIVGTLMAVLPKIKIDIVTKNGRVYSLVDLSLKMK